MKAEVHASAQDTVRQMLAHGMIKEIPPMLPDFDKAAGVRCPHQKHGVGLQGLRHAPVRLPDVDLRLVCTTPSCRAPITATTWSTSSPTRC